MGDSNIEWTDSTWNCVRGCRRVSPGCERCYAERQAIRAAGPGRAYEGLLRIVDGAPVPRWAGNARFVVEKLLEPMSWRTPRRVFVNSMSDIAHEDIHEDAIAAMFGVMAATPRHTYQILTKRMDRLRAVLHMLDEPWMRDAVLRHGGRSIAGGFTLPLPNVHIGVSVESQEYAERIDDLLETPAAVRFVSAEPLLGPLDLRAWLHEDGCPIACDTLGTCDCRASRALRLDWVIVGGESGPGARPCDVAWIRRIVEDCRAAGVPVFVKQLGAVVFDRNDAGFEGDPGDAWPGVSVECGDAYQGADARVLLANRKGGNPAEWPDDLRVREFPRARTDTPSAAPPPTPRLTDDGGSSEEPAPRSGTFDGDPSTAPPASLQDVSGAPSRTGAGAGACHAGPFDDDDRSPPGAEAESHPVRDEERVTLEDGSRVTRLRVSWSPDIDDRVRAKLGRFSLERMYFEELLAAAGAAGVAPTHPRPATLAALAGGADDDAATRSA